MNLDRLSALVFDLDGTLLNSQGRMTQHTYDALLACHQRGLLLYVATARPKRLALREWEAPGDTSFLTGKGAFYNGAEALDLELGFERHWLLPGELVHDLTGFLAATAPYADVALQHKELWHSFRLGIPEQVQDEWGFGEDERLPYEVARYEPCSKIVAWHGARPLDALHAEVVDRFGERVNAFLTDSRLWLVIVTREASKENALGELLALRNLSPEETVVFGDDTPDLGLFRAFPHTVAMANASPALKEAATMVTKSNEEDGVAHAIDYMIHQTS